MKGSPSQAHASSTVFVTNLPYDSTSDELQEFFEKFGEVKSCFAVRDQSGKNKGYGYVVFSDHANCETLLKDATKDALVFKGRQLRVELALKKRHCSPDEAIAPVPISSDTGAMTSGAAANLDGRPRRPTVKQHRLIVRNLVFSVTEKDIRGMFEKFGNIAEIVLPKDAAGSFRGFAFVQYQRRSQAQRAIKGLNGQQLLGRDMVVDFTLNKEDFEKRKGVSVSEDDDELRTCGLPAKRVKKSIIELRKSISSVNTQTILNEKEANKQTVFVKNLLFEVSEGELREKFSVFGEIYRVSFVNDSLGRKTGSAFICFRDYPSYTSCLETYREALDKVQSSRGSSDTSSTVDKLVLMELAPFWVLHNRWIDCFPYIDRVEATKKKELGLLAKRAVDKRNLYLMRESFVKRGSELAKQLDPSELTKRLKSQEDRMQQIKNPLFFVSKTRLVIHNLPLDMDEKSLRSLVMTSTAQFYNAVPSLCECSLLVDPLVGDLKQAKDKPVKAVQVKIMRNAERKDKSGRPRSLGYAFVELAEFGHALALLRQLNSVTSSTTLISRVPFAEFAIENSSIINARKNRRTGSLLP